MSRRGTKTGQDLYEEFCRGMIDDGEMWEDDYVKWSSLLLADQKYWNDLANEVKDERDPAAPLGD